MHKSVFALLAFLCCSPAFADAYKCRLADGSIEISNTPCKSGATTVSVRPDERVSESAREQTERETLRMRAYADKLEDKRESRQEEAPAEPASKARSNEAELPQSVVVEQPVQVVVRSAAPSVPISGPDPLMVCLQNVQEHAKNSVERRKGIANCEATYPSRPNVVHEVRSQTRIKHCPADQPNCPE